MIIRPITAQDCATVLHLFQQVHDLHAAARPDTYRPSPQAMDEGYFHSLLQSTDALLFGAEEAGQLVGFLHMTIKHTPNNRLVMPRSILYVEELVVEQAYRGKGIATALFAWVRQTAREQAVDDIELMVWGFNRSAIGFYEKMGMQVKNLKMEMKP